MSDLAEVAARVGVRELRADLTRYVRAARDGASILVTSHDQVIAEIRAPASVEQSARPPGGCGDGSG